MVTEEDIFYSTDPMETMKKALKNSNQELLRLIAIRPGTKEIKARMDELRQTIEQYWVSGIFERLYKLGNIFIYIILVLFFVYDIIN